MDPQKNKFGQRIAILRKNKNLSQAELAKIINIGTSTLGMYETGKREPNNEMLSRIADYFNVTTDYLLGRAISSDDKLAWQDLGMAYGGHIPDELKDMYRAIAEEYVKKHPEALKKKRK
ncbi:helix-turn-helix transcriptional regulator [Lactobacillus panisapium]|uniref:helix-turn-helix domain-containing protein n=1 Tax=Lactobacillus panisapium TaxID=2012495 RepID=UPI001C6A5C1F|nr:helix-turn-helix transcriptional regulator [Lactobacillus panisapium]QYN57001.1 helix-turn-helix transcriptional regulator [Lactobacillus panisapium]